MIQHEPEAVGLSSARLRRLSASIQAGVDRSEIPGAVVALGRRGKIGYFEAFGFRDREAGAAMQPDAIFRLASLTKPVTSLAAMMLAEGGKLSLAAPISQYLPELGRLEVGVEASDGSLARTPARRPITVLDLFRHTSGFTYGFLGNSAVKRLYTAANIASSDIDSATWVAKLAKLPLQFEPGTTWEYSVSTDVLGRIVEVVVGETLDAFIAAEITAPLRMSDTGFWVEPAKLERLAEPQRDPATGQRPPLRGVIAKPARAEGGGGMVSTASDYAQFCQFWLNGGELDGVRLISRKSVELMTADHLPPGIAFGPECAALFGPILPSPGNGYGFGLGFAVRTSQGRNPMHGSPGEYYWLGSAGPSFWIDPREQLFAILLMQAPTQVGPYALSMRALVYQALVD